MISRRLLLEGMATLSAGAWMGLTPALSVAASGADALESGFALPPPGARPWVYWFWINGNVTRFGVTADLEAMARVGIGGVLIMDVDPGTPAGPAAFMSPLWLDLLGFALHEARRLGLEVNLYNAAGWAGSAGPWITPELSMQKVVWSELAVDGGQRIETALVQPSAVRDFYRDIRVLAFPTPADDGYRLPFIAYKAGFDTKLRAYTAEQGVPPLPTAPASLPEVLRVDPHTVQDLSAHFVDGRLTWDAPTGAWTILRFGHTSTGTNNHPVSAAGEGLECDKLSKAAMDVHFAHFVGRILETQSALAGHGKTLVSTHIDSWEAGAQNWTAGFEAEFRRRCGYDLTPYLPVFTGRVVGDADVSERFLWDLRKTISNMVVENYAGELRRLANAHGLRLSIEAYDADPCDEMYYASQADEPQAEFWYGADFYPEVHRSWDWVADMTSSAHVYGKTIVAAESFTAMPDEKWQAHPALLKPLGDWAFSAGINRFIFHRYAMQPWEDRKPGMTMGPWGTHYDRTQTWWEESKPWHDYLTRCQYMLRQGLVVADLLYLAPEGAPMRFAAPNVDIRSGEPPTTPGYNFDGCPADAVFTRLAVKDGRIVLPDGMSYRLLVLPEPGEGMPGADAMTPGLMKRLADLVEAGMTLVGAPPLRSPSLSDQPAADHELAGLVARLWGDCDGVHVREHRYGKGRVVWGEAPGAVLAAMGVPMDFTCGPRDPFRYIHRRMSDGTEIYFVANKGPEPVVAECTFRVAPLRPELWRPETGAAERPAAYETTETGMRLALSLDSHESVFVIFRPGAKPEADRVVSRSDAANGLILTRSPTGELQACAEIGGAYTVRLANGESRSLVLPGAAPPISVAGAWEVSFDPGWGAPPRLVFPRLISWSDHADDGVRHFSGKAVYRKTLSLAPAQLVPGCRLQLDLGEVQVAARVALNGRELGVLWKPPFRLDVTDALHPGDNLLELTIVNLWPNRLIGDAKLPDDAQWKPNKFDGLDFGDSLAAWPAWLLQGKPSPTGRYTFATWKSWAAESPLLPSGLIGPVVIRSQPVQHLDRLVPAGPDPLALPKAGRRE